MLKVGITGGIGCGKTMVANLLIRLGNVPVYFADIEAKNLMNNNREIHALLYQHFGEGIFYETHKVDFKRLGEIVFKDHVLLKKLNAIVHPFTLKDFETWCQKQQAPYVLKEAALLFETDAFHYLDKIIGVDCPLNLRKTRIKKRNGWRDDEIEHRINSQVQDNIKLRLCDMVIINDEKHSLIQQCLDLHERLIQLA